MAKITKEDALNYHAGKRPGKIEVVPTKPYFTQTDLSLAYSPGVAEPCLEIQKNPQDAYKYTAKGNLVAVISNGTAVLGLGDIGAMAGKPVMEGKGLLFKIYGGIDVFDIEVNEKDPEKFIQAVKAIAPTFGGINLEDIKAPECFEIERRLKAELDIPVMHDDQHGTAIISSAGLINALQVAGKKIEEVKIVVNGAGASAISCTKLYVALGARRENILMLDSKGVITSDRPNLTEEKKFFATDRRDVHTLEEAIKGADVFLGLSRGNVLSQDMVRSMANNPIVFALANPVPEISYEDAMASRPDVLMSTGRSDYPNQINNVIGFPYIFRGALDVAATAINEEMKLAAVHAIADLAKKVQYKYYEITGKRGCKVTVSASGFVPKPYTAFQWFAQNDIETLRRKQFLLKDALKVKNITFQYHDAKTSIVEAIFARGDRRLGKVLLTAWQKGARFDGWSDCFSYDRWLESMAECGLDKDFYAARTRGESEVFPWEHVQPAVSRRFLWREWEKAQAQELTHDCRRSTCTGCGVCQKLGVEIIDYKRGEA